MRYLCLWFVVANVGVLGFDVRHGGAARYRSGEGETFYEPILRIRPSS